MKELSGSKVASRLQRDANLAFLQYQVRAQIDPHGNPLTQDELFDLKVRAGIGFRGNAGNNTTHHELNY